MKYYFQPFGECSNCPCIYSAECSEKCCRLVRLDHTLGNSLTLTLASSSVTNRISVGKGKQWGQKEEEKKNIP